MGKTMALLPRWSPLGDFGPHGDQNEFCGPLLVPFIVQSPLFSILGLRTRQKSVQPLYSASNTGKVLPVKGNLIANTTALKP